MDLKETFQEVLPILQKASPVICSSIDSSSGKIVCALIAAVVNAVADDPKDVAAKLKDDEDAYVKMQNLEATHATWIKSLQRHT